MTAKNSIGADASKMRKYLGDRLSCTACGYRGNQFHLGMPGKKAQQFPAHVTRLHPVPQRLSGRHAASLSFNTSAIRSPSATPFDNAFIARNDMRSVI